MILTQWFKHNEKPINIGVYERKFISITRSYSYWNGKHWAVCCDDVITAFMARKQLSTYQDLYWRGLAK